MKNLHISQKFYLCAIAFLVGVASAYFFYFSKIFFWILFVGNLSVVVLRFKNVKIFSLIILIVVCGNFYFQFHDELKNKSDIQGFVGQKIIVYGKILDEVDARIDHTKLIVTVFGFDKKLKNRKQKNEIQKVAGKILLKINRFPRFKFGDEIKFECKIQEPKVFDEFNYKKYLQRYKIYSICYYPKNLKSISQNKIVNDENLQSLLEESFYKKFVQGLFKQIFILKDKIEYAIEQTIHEPYASFLAGLLLGVRRGISPDLMEKFNATGTTHIIAVSGYNISLIAAILFNILPKFYISRKISMKILIISLILFTIITGMSASVVRAAIMGGLVIISKYLGRGSNMKNIIVLAVLCMILGNPYILMYDIGFHLSLFSTLGLIYLHPVVSYYSQRVPKIFGIQESFSTTVASMIATLPFVFFYFGRISFISIIVNVLILSVLPFAMLFGFIGVCIFWVSVDLARIIQWITFLILKYVIVVVEFFG